MAKDALFSCCQEPVWLALFFREPAEPTLDSHQQTGISAALLTDHRPPHDALEVVPELSTDLQQLADH